jgi:hypothetical protein
MCVVCPILTLVAGLAVISVHASILSGIIFTQSRGESFTDTHDQLSSAMAMEVESIHTRPVPAIGSTS